MNEITPEQLEEVRSNFDFFDRDSNGSIDFKEFSQLLRTISPKSTVQQAAEGFSMIDQNCDGAIDFDEFIQWWQQGWWEY